jgi:hypothetical protein
LSEQFLPAQFSCLKIFHDLRKVIRQSTDPFFILRSGFHYFFADTFFGIAAEIDLIIRIEDRTFILAFAV